MKYPFPFAPGLHSVSFSMYCTSQGGIQEWSKAFHVRFKQAWWLCCISCCTCFILQTPLSWQSKWDGPEDPMQYLRGLVTRAQAIQTWVEKAESGRLLQETLDLSELFHPDTFLNALRQQTARFVVYILNK